MKVKSVAECSRWSIVYHSKTGVYLFCASSKSNNLAKEKNASLFRLYDN